jgi:hypothetical protein
MSVRIIEGSVVHPTNRAYQHRGSIHDDATAQRLGFRGGTIAASTHLDTFPPILIAAYGERWFEDGCLSLYFRHATTDGEPVRAGLVAVDGGTSAASLVMLDGTVVAEGTASVGTPGDPSALSARDLRHDPTGLRISSGLEKGDVIGAKVTSCPSHEQSSRVLGGLVASPIEWYHGLSPWGPAVAAPSSVMEMFSLVAADFLKSRAAPAVGLWGAMEVRFHGEPIVCDVDYTVDGEIIALGQTPKTETVWYDLAARDSRGDLVATTRVLTRFAKASSPLYSDY